MPTKEEIKQARESLGISQDEAAALAGLGSKSRWSEYEGGIRNMPDTRWEIFQLRSGLSGSTMVSAARRAYLSEGEMCFRPVSWRGMGVALTFNGDFVVNTLDVSESFPSFAEIIGDWEVVGRDVVGDELCGGKRK